MITGQLFGALINSISPSSLQNKNIELTPGQIFRGVITKAFPGDMVQVQLGGTSIFAQLNAPLEVGQSAWLQVLPNRSPITLKIIDAPRNRESSQSQTTQENSSLEGLLRGVGLKPDRENVLHLKQLLDMGVPIKTEELGQMLEILKNSASPKQTAQIIQFASIKGYPLEAETIRSLQSVLLEPSVDKQLSLLFDLAKGNPSATKELEPLSSLWKKIQTLLDAASTPTEDSIPNQADLKEQTPIQKYLQLLGIEHEYQLTQKLLQLHNEGIKNPEDQNQLKAILLELKGSENLTQSMKEVVDKSIHWITGQQLLLSNDANAPWSSYILQIPLLPSQTGDPAFIHIEGRKNGKEALDLENCHLFFHLQLDALQKTLVDIQIQNRMMNVHIYNDSPFLKAWVDEQRKEWVEPMQALGYQLSVLKVQPLPKESSINSTNPQQSFPIKPTNYRGVDLRV